MPIDSALVEIIVLVSKDVNLVTEQLLEEISRVLKPGGKILVQAALASNDGINKVIISIPMVDKCMAYPLWNSVLRCLVLSPCSKSLL